MATAAEQIPQTMSVRKASVELDVSTMSIHRFIADGRLKKVDVPGATNILVDAASVETLKADRLENQRIDTDAAG